MTRGQSVLLATVVPLAAAALVAAPQSDGRSRLADLVSQLTRESKWTLTAKVPVGFPTFHPQGMVKIGDTLFVSSVEVKTPTKRFRSADRRLRPRHGRRRRHLFKFDAKGNLLTDLTLGEGTIYHPGGIDYDGTTSGCRSPNTGRTAVDHLPCRSADDEGDRSVSVRRPHRRRRSRHRGQVAARRQLGLAALLSAGRSTQGRHQRRSRRAQQAARR